VMSKSEIVKSEFRNKKIVSGLVVTNNEQ